MRVSCAHGYFKFEEQKAGQISDFINLFGFDLVLVEDFFTFSFLADAKNYSVLGADYLGVPATTTFEGIPSEVMRKNNLVYDFTQDLVLPIASVINSCQIQQTAKYFLSSGLILPGSGTDAGQRVTDYSAWFLFDSMKFKYSEIDYV